ncbi:hypothetical protein K443DRAFT_117414, partial [Laccaria amethystina LaAM-08-1]
HGMKHKEKRDLAHPARIIVTKASGKGLTKPRKRLQKGRGDDGESKHGGSEEARAKSQKGSSQFRIPRSLTNVCSTLIAVTTSNSDTYNDVRKGSKLPTKGKPNTKIKQTNAIEVDDLDESLSPLSDGSQGLSEGSDGSDDEDDDDFDVARMTDREVRQMFTDELRCLTTITTSKSPLRGAAQKLHDPPRPNPKGCLAMQAIQAKRRLTRTTPSLCTSPWLLERPTTQAVHSTAQKSKSKVGAVTIASDDDDRTIPEDNWPKALQLRTGALTQQTDLIRVVCREAIRIVERTLVMEHAWPELHKGTLYKRQVLLEAVKLLRAKNTEDDEGEQDAQYKALNSRLSNDEKFIRYIGKWVCGLVTSPLNTLATCLMTGSYHLHHVAPTVAVEHLDQLPEMK